MNLFEELKQNMTRRYFFSQGSNVMGTAALASLLGQSATGGVDAPKGHAGAMPTHFSAKAKHIIYLHMVGGPSQLDLYDHKPQMDAWYDKDLPESVRNGQRLTTMTSGQARFPIAPSKFKFEQAGQCGMWVTELLPWTKKVVDDMTFVRSMYTEAINHEPWSTWAIMAMLRTSVRRRTPALSTTDGNSTTDMKLTLGKQPSAAVVTAEGVEHRRHQIPRKGRSKSVGILPTSTHRTKTSFSNSL
jgi:hypothetical protein